jgi:protein-S-isoprenylcysteine O-methyltransferase Ste14
MTQRILHAAQILWPAFLVAGVLEMVVFSWVDPTLMQWGTWRPEPQTTYSVAFLTFWALITLSSLLSHWMMKSTTSPAEMRRARRQARRQQA